MGSDYCPVVGSVRCLASNGSHIFAGADSGVYISSDNGVNWAQSNNGLTNKKIYSFAVNGTIIYFGLIDVFQSTNNGSDWTPLGLSNADAFSLLVSNNNIFAGTGGGVYLSTNNGANWNQVNNGLNNSMDVHALAVSGNNIFAGAAGYGVYLSTNNGSSWTQKNNGITNVFVHSLLVSGNNIFAGTENGLFLSTNNGSDWALLNNGQSSSWVQSLSANGTELFAGTLDAGIFLSTDNGSTWIQQNEGLTDNSVLSLDVIGTYLFAGTQSHGLWKRPLSELTGISSELKDLPHNFTLSQNYPNPFNPGTVISWSLPSASYLRLTVFNTLGQTIKILENGFKQEGNYSINFNAVDLPDGIYFYK
jgi:photosystem II stability/assembly factor-like uncharacterized protein